MASPKLETAAEISKELMDSAISANVIFVDGHFSHINNLLLVRYCREFFDETGTQVEVTKDNFLSHLVMLWFKTEGGPKDCPAFNVGPTLQSGFARCGLFPFSPETIRGTVKLFYDPTVNASGIRQIEPGQDHEELFELLRRRYGITSDIHHEEVRDCVENVQKGTTSGKVLAGALAKSLMDDAPKKRKQKNTMLNLTSGAMVTSDEIVKTAEMIQAENLGKKAALKATNAAEKAGRQAGEKVASKAAEKAATRAAKAAEKEAEKAAKAAERTAKAVKKAAVKAVKAVAKAAAKLSARDAKAESASERLQSLHR
ncbi:hypothetical protein RvY_01103 [Ramazzottius varieornatus]|uniref:Uncharacterized protein n=1 Tax=Ramazzottius varieornatus TaxID=947166 RepID=A0A1D1UJ36_RAMVA|nr:hypothetical protein RvY_01103 [Ramazzottius varieornatus]